MIWLVERKGKEGLAAQPGIPRPPSLGADTGAARAWVKGASPALLDEANLVAGYHGVEDLFLYHV